MNVAWLIRTWFALTLILAMQALLGWKVWTLERTLSEAIHCHTNPKENAHAQQQQQQ